MQSGSEFRYISTLYKILNSTIGLNIYFTLTAFLDTVCVTGGQCKNLVHNREVFAVSPSVFAPEISLTHFFF
jgi:hypothetical protein